MKILFVWRQYHQIAGGVERTSIELMNEMRRRGHEIHLMSWDAADARAYYPMDPQIDWFKLDEGDSTVKAGWGLRFKRMAKIRNHIKKIKPDVILAYMDGIFLSTKLSILGLHIPTVEAERCSAARFKFLGSPLRTALIFQSLRLARRITVQLESYRRDYPGFLRKRIVSIPNPVSQATSLAFPAGAPGQPKTLLSVGRLSYQKNYSVLIKAFAQIAAACPEWVLTIAGEGEETDSLKRLIASFNLQNRITLLGPVRDVQSLYTAAHLFCLPSRWEGFPNALAEALAHGLPAVGFAGCLGVCDLIDDGRNGLLADGTENTDTLAAALKRLMDDDTLRAQMGTQATESMQQYAPAHIFDRWEQFFKEVSSLQ